MPLYCLQTDVQGCQDLAWTSAEHGEAPHPYLPLLHPALQQPWCWLYQLLAVLPPLAGQLALTWLEPVATMRLHPLGLGRLLTVADLLLGHLQLGLSRWSHQMQHQQLPPWRAPIP